MEDILEILKYVLPSVIVFGTAYFILKTYLDNDIRKRNQELRLANQKTLTPLRLQAYERVVLFLERVAPDSLIMRTQKPMMSVQQLHSALLNAIRAEFEHNLSQQIYISGAAWDVIKSSKEQLIKIINLSAEQLKQDAPAIELSATIMRRVMEVDKTPNQVAIDYIRKEMGQFFS